MMLDLESVRLFVLAADLASLTRAAEAAGTVQPVVSQRLKALEEKLGRRLLDRTPRFVRPTAEGAAFLIRARDLLDRHDEALNFAGEAPVRFRLGVSDHAFGVAAPDILRALRAALPPSAALDIRLGPSQAARIAFDAGELDAAVVRREVGGAEGEVLGADPLGWRAGEGFVLPSGGPIPLALLAAPCGVRAAALRALDDAGRPWREALVAGSCTALVAGVRAGLGVAPMGRLASGELPDQGPALALPPLADSEIVLFARTGSRAAAEAVRALSAGIRASLGASSAGSPRRRRPNRTRT
jgi:DNA-binding transcriptional LysR family regulator